MIGEAILAVFSGVSGFFLGMLPLGAILGSLTLSAGWLYGYDVLNAFLPVSEVLAAGTVLLTMRTTMLAVKAARFVWSLVPGF